MNFLHKLVIPTCCCVALILPEPVFSADTQKPNVLFIAIDDLRPELGCYGHPVAKSPNIDKLASQGTLFNRAYCQLALCNPSRASLLSGRRSETLGIHDLKTFVRDGKNRDVVTLPELFRKNGYRSMRFGKIFHATNGNHDDAKSWGEPIFHDDEPTTRPRPDARQPKAAGPTPDPMGADHANELPWGNPDVPDEELMDGRVARNAIRALNENSTQPLFLAVGFHKPHLPFIAPKKYWDMYDASQINIALYPELPKDAPAFASNNSSELRRYKGVPKQAPPTTDDEARRLLHAYYACVSYTDAQIGKVLDELDRLKLRDNTIVVLWGDHGYQLGEHGTWAKRTNWEICTRVPLIISAPNQKSRGAKTHGLVELVDLYPTLSDYCGLPLIPKLEGTSLLPLLDQPDRPWKSAAFSWYRKEKSEPGAGMEGFAMRTDRYRFIEWRTVADDQTTAPVYELYDHQTDPQEIKNVANLPANQELVRELKQQLAAGWKAAVPK